MFDAGQVRRASITRDYADDLDNATAFSESPPYVVIPHPSHSSSRSRVHPWMVGAAWLCMAAQLFALAHLIVVQHERCPEHGELIHVGSHAAVSIAAPVSLAAIITAQALPALPGESEGNHDHCLSATERRDLCWSRVAAVFLIPPAGGEALHRGAATPTVARALYRSAPKTSPPYFA